MYTLEGVSSVTNFITAYAGGGGGGDFYSQLTSP